MYHSTFAHLHDRYEPPTRDAASARRARRRTRRGARRLSLAAARPSLAGR